MSGQSRAGGFMYPLTQIVDWTSTEGQLRDRLDAIAQKRIYSPYLQNSHGEIWGSGRGKNAAYSVWYLVQY